jgi:hypothetical protein
MQISTGSESVKLSTDRLELVATTFDHIRAEMEAPERLESLLNAQVEPSWPPGEYALNGKMGMCMMLRLLIIIEVIK